LTQERRWEVAPPEVQKIFAAPSGAAKAKTTQTASLTLYRYSPFSGTKNGVHLPATFIATIHDAIICKVEDAAWIRQIMEQQYGALGVKPTIKENPC